MQDLIHFRNVETDSFLNETLVSIGYPVYNGECYIQKSMEALLNQTYKNFEIIISDNASTDGTQALCISYASMDSRIRYIRQSENIGAAKNLNFVLNEAKGRYFMWNASDDIRTTNCLQYYLDNIGTANAFYSSYAQYSFSSDKIIRVFNPPLLLGSSESRCQDVSEYFNKTCPSMIYGLFKTELIKKIKFENVDWSDVLLVTKYIVLFGYKTTIASPTVYLGFAEQAYRIKPFNGRFLNPLTLLLKTFRLVVFKGGYLGWFYFSKRMLSVIFISLKFNLFKK